MTRHWIAPSIIPNWQETTGRYRRKDRKASRSTKPKDSVTAGEVCALMKTWRRP